MPDIWNVAGRALTLWICCVCPLPLQADMLETLAAKPTYLDIKISPDGSKIATLVRVDDGVGVLTMDTTSMKALGWLKPNEFQSVGVHWGNNTRLIVEMAETSSTREQLTDVGDLYAVNYDITKGEFIFGPKAGDGRSASRTSNREDQYAWARIIDMLPDDPSNILISSEPYSRYGSEIPSVVRLNINTGRTKELTRGPIRKSAFLTDNNHEVRLAVGIDADSEPRGFYRPKKSRQWIPLADVVDKSFYPLSVKDDILLFLGRAGGERSGLHRMNLLTGERTLIYQHDLVDITSPEMSVDEMDVLALRVDPGYSSYLIINKEHPETASFRNLLKEFSGLRVSIISRSTDGTKSIVLVESDIYPGIFYLYEKGKLKFLFKQFPDLPNEQLVNVEPVELTARDGLPLRGYLTRGSNDKSAPLVMLVHGGPHGIRDYWAFDPEVQMLASLGFNVLQVNFRGSGGYGKSFAEAGYREWGRNIQHDIIDATHWAIAEGITLKDKICIMGGSFGGYSALQSSILEPNLFQCAVGVAGVYDLPLLFKKGDVQQAFYGTAYLEQVLGSDQHQLAAYSPVRNAGRLKASALIVHGVADQRAPVAHARRLMVSLDDAGKKYQSHIEDKEGHGFFSEENRLEYFKLVAGFLQKELGGRLE